MLQSDGFGPAYRDLARREPVFARLITVYGRPDPFEWHDRGRTGSSQFTAMLLHIVGQRIVADQPGRRRPPSYGRPRGTGSLSAQR